MTAIAHENETRPNMSPQRLVERAKSTLSPHVMASRCEWYANLPLERRADVRLWLEAWVLPDLDWAAVKLMRRKSRRA